MLPKWTPQDSTEILDRIGVAMGLLADIQAACLILNPHQLVNAATDAKRTIEEIQTRAIELGGVVS